MAETLEEALKEIAAGKERETTLKADLTSANAEAAHHRKSKGELKDSMAGFAELGLSVDDVKTLKANAAKVEQDRLKQAGQFDEALEKGLATANGEIETLKGLITGKDTKLSKVLIDNAVLSAIDGKAVNNDQVLALLRGSIKMEGDSPVVMDGDKHKLHENGEHMGVGAYAVDFLEKNPHLAKASGGGSGSQGGANGGDGGATVTRTEFDAMSDEGRNKHLADNGAIVD